MQRKSSLNDVADASKRFKKMFPSKVETGKTRKIFDDRIIGLLVLLAGLCVRLYKLAYPPGVAFDEAHFAKFAEDYVEGRFHFDIHPPMAKLTFALIMYLSGYNTKAGQPYLVGTTYSDPKFYNLRFTAAFLSALCPMFTYWNCRLLGASPLASILAASMVLFDGVWHVMATKIITDSFLWFFIVLSIFCALKMWSIENIQDTCISKEAYSLPMNSTPTKGEYKKYWRSWFFWCIATGVAMAHVISVKWTGLGLIGAIGIRHILRVLNRMFFLYLNDPQLLSSSTTVSGMFLTSRYLTVFASYLRWCQQLGYHLSYCVKRSPFLRTLLMRIIGGVIMLGLIIVFYMSYWRLHFWALSNTGPGDGWMPEQFRAFLHYDNVTDARNWHHQRVENDWKKPSFLSNFLHIHQVMYNANANMPLDPHPYRSWFLTWPFLGRGVAFWVSSEGGNDSFIYMIGNPFVWMLALCCFVLCSSWLIYVVYLEGKLSERQTFYTSNLGWLMFGFLVSFLPFCRVTRSTFLYHYIPAMYWNILMVPLVIEFFLRWTRIRQIVLLLLLICCSAFWYGFTPIFYGTHVPPGRIHSLKWKADWW